MKTPPIEESRKAIAQSLVRLTGLSAEIAARAAAGRACDDTPRPSALAESATETLAALPQAQRSIAQGLIAAGLPIDAATLAARGRRL